MLSSAVCGTQLQSSVMPKFKFSLFTSKPEVLLFIFLRETLLTSRIIVGSLCNLTDCRCLRERQSVALLPPKTP